MEQYLIHGGNSLVGEVEIGGAKNAALPILAASIMTDETVHIDNVPDVRDTNVLMDAMGSIGIIVNKEDRHRITINAANIGSTVVCDDNIKKIRASYYLIGAMLGKYKTAEVTPPEDVTSVAEPSISISKASELSEPKLSSSTV